MKTQTNPTPNEKQEGQPEMEGFSPEEVFDSLPLYDQALLGKALDALKLHESAVTSVALLLEMDNRYARLRTYAKETARPLLDKLHEQIFILHVHMIELSDLDELYTRPIGPLTDENP